jgi:hypothetical protein
MPESESCQPRYDVCKKGSLTYYRYYLEDESAPVAAPARKARFKRFAIALISSGLALISFAAGVSFAKMGHQSTIIKTR